MMQPTGQEPRHPSTKGSCVAPNPSRKDTHTDILNYRIGLATKFSCRVFNIAAYLEIEFKIIS
ncbi:hypothetical protein CR513_55752, partial [Mucuna pruriens]